MINIVKNFRTFGLEKEIHAQKLCSITKRGQRKKAKNSSLKEFVQISFKSTNLANLCKFHMVHVYIAF